MFKLKWFKRFSTKLILIQIGIVLLIVAAIGIPASLMIRSQLQDQAWNQVYQGIQVVNALYRAQQQELDKKAILASQRPSLENLTQNRDNDSLRNYLLTLQRGTGLDMIAICQKEIRFWVSTLDGDGQEVCSLFQGDGIKIIPHSPTPAAWIISSQPVPWGEFQVIVGRKIDDSFAREIESRTGLDQIVLIEGIPAASSVDLSGKGDEISNSEIIFQPYPGITEGFVLEIGNSPYVASVVKISEGKSVQEMILYSTAEIRKTQIRLLNVLLGVITGSSILVTFLAWITSRQISLPLEALADYAGHLHDNQLSVKAEIPSTIDEINKVADALDGTRRELLQTLNSLRQEKKWASHLLDSIVEGIVTLNDRCQITFFSRGAEKITGLESDLVLQKDCNQFFQLENSPKTFCDSIPESGKRHKLNITHADGTPLVLAITRTELAPSNVGEDDTVLVFRDISEEEAAHRVLGNFILNIAHEFKSPLSALAASVELLLETSNDIKDPDLIELLLGINLGVVGLQNLVENLLESASMEAGHFSISQKPVNLGEIIIEAVGTMEPLINKYNQQFSLEVPADLPSVWADKRRIYQVCVNLISNAIKYGPDNGLISIQSYRDQTMVVTEINDQGEGVPEHAREKVFRRFTRLSPQYAHVDAGAGLGLSVVKEIVLAHGGEVGIRDTNQGGASFFFAIPIYQDENIL